MINEPFLTIDYIFFIGGCAFAVYVVTSLVHHFVKKITRWWGPGRGAFLFSAITGGLVQVRFIKAVEPFHLAVIAGNIILIYLSAVGFNAVVGSPVNAVVNLKKTAKGRVKKKGAVIIAMPETWRTRWFG